MFCNYKIMSCKTLYGSNPDEIYDLIGVLGFSRQHAEEIALNIYRRKITGIIDFKNIPKNLKAVLNSWRCVGLYNYIDYELPADGSARMGFTEILRLKRL